MPLYEYHCPRCSHKFEKLQPMSATGADCPNCEQPAKRAISMFAPGGRRDRGPRFRPRPPAAAERRWLWRLRLRPRSLGWHFVSVSLWELSESGFPGSKDKQDENGTILNIWKIR